MLRRLTQVLALAGALAGGAAEAQEKVVVGLPGAPWSVQFGYYAFGEELGFFKEEGIGPLEYVSVSGSAVLLPQVANGQVQFGYANPDLAVIALAKGEPLPVTFVMNWLRSQTFEFVTLESSSVRELKGLKGRKMGVGALTWGNLPLSRAMLITSCALAATSARCSVSTLASLSSPVGYGWMVTVDERRSHCRD